MAPPLARPYVTPAARPSARPSAPGLPVLALTAEELDGWDTVLPVDGAKHVEHLLSGEGEPWPASSG